MSKSLYEGLGIFGHVPTPHEAEAKAFVMPLHAQPEGFWAGYCCGLSDAGVSDTEVVSILGAACKGEFSHMIEPVFYDELSEGELRDDE